MYDTTTRIEFANGSLFLGLKRTWLLHCYSSGEPVELNGVLFTFQELMDEGAVAHLKPIKAMLFDPLKWQKELASEGAGWSPRYPKT